MNPDEESDDLLQLRARLDEDLGLPAPPDLQDLASAEPIALTPEFVERTLGTVRQVRARSRRTITVHRLRVAALVVVMVAAAVAGTRYVHQHWDGQDDPTSTLDFESAVAVLGETNADDNRRNLALLRAYKVVEEALTALRSTHGDCPEPLQAAIDNARTHLRAAIERGRQEPLPGGMPVVHLPPVLSLANAHAAVANPQMPLDDRLRALTTVEDAVLVGIRSLAFVQHTPPTDTWSAKNAKLLLEKLAPLTRN